MISGSWECGHSWVWRNMKIGYVRISTHEQSEILQRDALAFCDRIFFEVASGAKRDRIELERAIASLRSGDTFCVWRLDRMGRNLRHLLNCVEEIQATGANFQSVTEGFDTSTASGRLFFAIAAAFAEFERHLLIDRTRAGIFAARARGRTGGKKQTLSEKEVETAKILRSNGQTVPEICRFLGISKTTYYNRCFDSDRSKN